MDKRTLLAFVLIGVIILVMPKYQDWIFGKPSVLGEKQVSDSRLSPPSSPVFSSSPPVKAGSLASLDSLPPSPERLIIVENDLFISRWSTRGGVLTSCVLKDFKTSPGGVFVDLVGIGGAGMGLSLDGDDLAHLSFVPSLDSLSVHGDRSVELSFVGRWRDCTVEKRITIFGNRYGFGFDLSVVGGVNPLRSGLSWRGGIGSDGSSFADESSHTKVITFLGGVVENWDTGEIQSSRSRPTGEGGWVGLRNRYFLVAFVPDQVGRFGMDVGGAILDGRKAFDIGLHPDTPRERWSGYLYGGPISYSVLRSYAGGELQRAMTWGWEWARWFMEPIGIGILRIFLDIHTLAPNYGVVIILFSILVKIVLYPLTHKSYEATAKMQEIQPVISALKEKYGSDQQRLNQEMMRLYKEQGINPLGGCFPVLFQMPILFALFNVFQNAIELRQAPFFGWISDLSQPEYLVVGGFHLHVLPILMAFTMFLQQRSTVKDPSQKVMVYMMPLMMIFFFWGMSSGLVLYWTLFNILSWVQQVGIGLFKSTS